MKHKAKKSDHDRMELNRAWDVLNDDDKRLMVAIVNALADGETPKTIQGIISSTPHLSRAKKAELIKIF